MNTTSLSNQLSRDLVKKLPAGKTSESRGEGLPDFQNLIQDSNQAHKAEEAKKQATMGEDGELRIGESKDDKDFRNMLERVTGQKQRKHKNNLEKEDFLNLMVTQLKYQDPTKPTDHQDMAAQLAQFNTVEQLAQANKSLDNMAKGQEELKAEKLTDYLGREVTSSGDRIRLGPDATPISGTKSSFSLPIEAGAVTISIKNSQNEVVRTMALGSLASGEHPVAWDGMNNKGEKVGAGTFTFEVVAQTTDGKKIEAEKNITAEVTGISQLAKGGQLETAIGEVKSKDIVAVRKPGTAPESIEKKEVASLNTVPDSPARSLAADDGSKTREAVKNYNNVSTVPHSKGSEIFSKA
jgi:flagellar basal-body rod modification protein FlgD